MSDAERQPAAEYTATTRPCRYCEEPVTQPRRKGAVKEFCTNRHRAAYRDQESQKAMQGVIDAADELQDALEQGMAKMDGAIRVLRRFQKKSTRTKKTT